VHSIAARLADAVGFTGLGRVHEDGQHAEPARFRTPLVDEDVAAVRSAAGSRLSDLELQVLVQVVVVTDDPVDAAEEICRQHAPGLAPQDLLESPYVLIGSTAGLVDELRAHRQRWGFSHFTVRAEALGRLDPVIAELAGR
jgi:hypothetical protein